MLMDIGVFYRMLAALADHTHQRAGPVLQGVIALSDYCASKVTFWKWSLLRFYLILSHFLCSTGATAQIHLFSQPEFLLSLLTVGSTISKSRGGRSRGRTHFILQIRPLFPTLHCRSGPAALSLWIVRETKPL